MYASKNPQVIDERYYKDLLKNELFLSINSPDRNIGSNDAFLEYYRMSLNWFNAELVTGINTIIVSYPIWPSWENWGKEKCSYKLVFDSTRYIDYNFEIKVFIKTDNQLLDATFAIDTPKDNIYELTFNGKENNVLVFNIDNSNYRNFR